MLRLVKNLCFFVGLPFCCWIGMTIYVNFAIIPDLSDVARELRGFDHENETCPLLNFTRIRLASHGIAALVDTTPSIASIQLSTSAGDSSYAASSRLIPTTNPRYSILLVMRDSPDRREPRVNLADGKYYMVVPTSRVAALSDFEWQTLWQHDPRNPVDCSRIFPNFQNLNVHRRSK